MDLANDLSTSQRSHKDHRGSSWETSTPKNQLTHRMHLHSAINDTALEGPSIPLYFEAAESFPNQKTGQKAIIPASWADSIV